MILALVMIGIVILTGGMAWLAWWLINPRPLEGKKALQQSFERARKKEDGE